MRYKEVRGGPWDFTHDREGRTYQGLPEATRTFIGFRLVFDGPQRIARGMPWSISDPEALAALSPPHSKGSSVGFRLAREDT